MTTIKTLRDSAKARHDYENYKYKRNYYTYLLRKSKQEFYYNLIEQSKFFSTLDIKKSAGVEASVHIC